MREIKFRGKRVYNGEWVYGGFHKHQKITPCPIIPKGEKAQEPDYAYLIIESGFSDWNLPKPLLAHEVDPKTVGQFTGQYDKSGKEIYAGDIVGSMDGHDGEYSSEAYITGEVFWDDETISWQVSNRIEAESCEILASENETLEVIGNIHDNLELLGEQT